MAQTAAINKSNQVRKALLSLIPSQADNNGDIFLVIQQDRNLRALSAWKQMARQLVGISAMLPYMFWDKIYSSCAQLRSCNVIMQSKRGRVEDKVLHFTHKPILKHINEHMFHLHLSFQTRQLKLPVLPVLQIFKNISQLNHRITFTLSFIVLQI